ncbi:hypothetical protein SK128_025876 [Halocaridina rubra]|uniref:(3R)-3-hydroxyacyl-CoA dehydrogenase n=1 Tax=Halocaridina rubra TaxID=373956 RepID=A0AAN8WLX5_HALRR
MATIMLPNKLALVTGGGSGIGRATCLVLEREGAVVIASDLNLASAQETVTMMSDPSKHLALMVDVTKAEYINSAFAAIRAKYNAPPTLLVNSAGITGISPLVSLEEDLFAKVIDVNFKGTYLASKAVANALIKENLSGSIVNVASITGVAGLQDNSCYAGSKGGVIAFTKSVCKELIKSGIRVNSVLPGPIDTPMLSVDNDIVKFAIDYLTPIGRAGQPKEVAEVIAFLLSERSSFMVGSCVEVTGGYRS